MRRASVLVAVTAVSLVIVSACTSFPDLTVDESAGDDDAASSSNGDDGGAAQSDDAGHDSGTSATDAAAGRDAGSDASTGTKDAAPPDAAQPDSGADPCAATSIDCSVTANKMCPPCMAKCGNGCTNVLQNCCVNETGNKYTACCYYPGIGSCTNGC